MNSSWISGTRELGESPALGGDFLPPLRKMRIRLFYGVKVFHLFSSLFASVNFWNKSLVGGAGARMRGLTTLAGLAAVRTPGMRSLAWAGRYLWTSLWVHPMCIISLVSVSNLAAHWKHFFEVRQ